MSHDKIIFAPTAWFFMSLRKDPLQMQTKGKTCLWSSVFSFLFFFSFFFEDHHVVHYYTFHREFFFLSFSFLIMIKIEVSTFSKVSYKLNPGTLFRQERHKYYADNLITLCLNFNAYINNLANSHFSFVSSLAIYATFASFCSNKCDAKLIKCGFSIWSI